MKLKFSTDKFDIYVDIAGLVNRNAPACRHDLQLKMQAAYDARA